MNPVNHFDFFVGTWQVKHRRLKERLCNSQEWQEFVGRCSMHKILGGLGNFDDNWLDLPGGAYCAATLRTFDIETGLWSIWWLDGRQPGQLDTPVRGGFENGIGTFYADDTLNGQPIRVRFQWAVPQPDQPHWEQAFSSDGGQHWETNWEMDFVRTLAPFGT